jgi:hypothetical protein
MNVLTQFNQALYSLEECNNCYFNIDNTCFDPIRLTSAKEIESQIDCSFKPSIEAITRCVNTQFRQDLKRLQTACNYYIEA